MWTLPRSAFQKIGIVIYGLAVGVGTALSISAAFLVLGSVISLFAQSTGWIHLGEYQPWLPIMGAEYGLFIGLVLGALVCWKVWRSRFDARTFDLRKD
jgi:hypothetical protein